MSGHIHTDFYSIALTAVGVFLFAHVIRVVAAQVSKVDSLKPAATSVGAFFTLG